jgi:NAD+--dinitrogen-reductase ADP-D-ribosyltransferase
MPTAAPSLPRDARLPLNRCNLPAVVLGGLTYQAHPVPLELDGVCDFHRDLFINRLLPVGDHAGRAERFADYMAVRFCLQHLEDARHTAGSASGRRRKKYRTNANYLRMVRGWSFDSDGREGAVLKHWVETRFGLRARYHGGPLDGSDSDAYHHYVMDGSTGLYATNALEAQLDLLYAYGQYELIESFGERTHLTLFRGINSLDGHEVLERLDGSRARVLLNNLSSFTSDRERACEFGDYIMEVAVPLPKIFFYNRLLPGMLKGEDEYVVIGGVYEVRLSTF